MLQATVEDVRDRIFSNRDLRGLAARAGAGITGGR